MTKGLFRGLSLTMENFYGKVVPLENANRIEYLWNRGPLKGPLIEGEKFYRV